MCRLLIVAMWLVLLWLGVLSWTKYLMMVVVLNFMTARFTTGTVLIVVHSMLLSMVGMSASARPIMPIMVTV